MASLAIAALVERMRSPVTIEHRDIRCSYELVIAESSARPVNGSTATRRTGTAERRSATAAMVG